MRRASILLSAILAVLCVVRPAAASTFDDARVLILAPETTAALITPYHTQLLLTGLVNTAEARHRAGDDVRCLAILRAALGAVQQVTHAYGQPGPNVTRFLHPRARFYGDPASETAALGLEAALGKLTAECGG